MDNISKKTLVQTGANLANYILLVSPVIADGLGIITFFVPNFQTWVNERFGVFSRITIIVLVNVVLIANILILLDRRVKKKNDKAKKLVESYSRLLEKYAYNLIGFEEKCKKVTSTEELYELLSGYLKDFVDEIKNVLCDVTNEKIRVCIKSFPEKYPHNDVTKMELVTFCRSDKGLQESKIEYQNRTYVHENTDFKLIMVDAYPYFAFNDLQTFEKQTLTVYENSTKDWMKKYNATIVYPISKCIESKNGKNRHEVLGFLCADTLSIKAFSAEIGPMCIKFIDSMSYLMYVFLDKSIEYSEKLTAA